MSGHYIPFFLFLLFWGVGLISKTQYSWKSILNLRFSRLEFVCNFGFWRWTTSNIENYPMFRQTLHLPSSGWTRDGWAFLEALYGANRKRRVGFDGVVTPEVSTNNSSSLPAANPVLGSQLWHIHIEKKQLKMFVERLGTFQHSTLLIPESQSCTV